MNFGYALNRARCDAQADARLRTYVGRTFALRRAYDVYAGLLSEFPDYPGKDRVLFHMAQCVAKLMDYRPAKGVDVPWVFPGQPSDATAPRAALAHERVAGLFERLVRECPGSPLVDRAEAARFGADGAICCTLLICCCAASTAAAAACCC